MAFGRISSTGQRREDGLAKLVSVELAEFLELGVVEDVLAFRVGELLGPRTRHLAFERIGVAGAVARRLGDAQLFALVVHFLLVLMDLLGLLGQVLLQDIDASPGVVRANEPCANPGIRRRWRWRSRPPLRASWLYAVISIRLVLRDWLTSRLPAEELVCRAASYPRAGSARSRGCSTWPSCSSSRSLLDHRVQDLGGLDLLELGADEVGVVGELASGFRPGGLTTLASLVDLDARRALEGRLEHHGDAGSGEEHQQKHRQDHRLADPDDAPVIEKVQGRFLTGAVFGLSIVSKKRG